MQEGESDQTVTKCWQHQHTLQLCDILFTKSTLSKHDRIARVTEPLETDGIYPNHLWQIIVLFIAFLFYFQLNGDQANQIFDVSATSDLHHLLSP